MNSSSRRSDRYCKIFEPIGIILAIIGMLVVVTNIGPEDSGIGAAAGAVLMMAGWCVLKSMYQRPPFSRSVTSQDFLVLFALKILSLIVTCLLFAPTERELPLVFVGSMVLAWIVFLQIKLLNFLGEKLGDWLQQRPFLNGM